MERASPRWSKTATSLGQTYSVNLKSLKVGINGDYTVSSSERLYGSYFMQEKLLYAYEEKAKGTKTLIFNNGIHTSLMVAQLFEEEGMNPPPRQHPHREGAPGDPDVVP